MTWCFRGLAPLFVLYSSAPLLADVDTVVDYATRCFARLEMNPADLPATFACKSGTQLFTSVDGVLKDIHIGGAANPNAAAGFPPACDRPALLSNKCYGNSYATIVAGIKNEKVKAALLCRHKKVWSDGDKNFDDVAMIFHNRKNGQTCWFQALGDGLDGTKVPAPHKDTGGFFLKPSAAAKIECVRCHDNGPWMNSRWLNDNLRVLKDPKTPNEFKDENPIQDKFGPYLNDGIEFSKWKPTKFVSVGRKGLPDRQGEACTSCHHIAAAETANDGNAYKNCKQWIDFTVGRGFSPVTNATGKEFPIAFWMPDEHPFTKKADWDGVYKKHVDALVACCTAKGVGVAGCDVVTPKVTLAPSPINGVRLAALTSAGAQAQSVAPSSGLTIPIRPGTSVTIGWSADAGWDVCSIEATFPPGVVSPTGMHTASNWNLDDSPQHTGSLTSPGLYRFDIYCDRDNTTNMTFEVSGAPAAALNVQALVNNSASVKSAKTSDTVYVSWSADHVHENSCMLSELFGGVPTGRSWNTPSGLMEIPLQAKTVEAYQLTCVALDGTTRIAQTTVEVTQPEVR